MTAVDQMVEDHKNQMELQDIQGKLEISVPKSAKGCDRKKVKSLNLMAQERKLKKRGEAQWKGHGKHLCKWTDSCFKHKLAHRNKCFGALYLKFVLVYIHVLLQFLLCSV